jgi:hypothetical protein
VGYSDSDISDEGAVAVAFSASNGAGNSFIISSSRHDFLKKEGKERKEEFCSSRA